MIDFLLKRYKYGPEVPEYLLVVSTFRFYLEISARPFPE